MIYRPSLLGVAVLALTQGTAACAQPASDRPAIAAATNASHTLVLTVEGVRSDRGQIRAQLLVRKSAEAAAETVGYLVEPARMGTVTMTFRNLPAADYAVQLFHDENDNGKVDMNLVGIPTEGFGFSNIPQVQGGIPPFDRMKVKVSGTAAATAVLAYAP